MKIATTITTAAMNIFRPVFFLGGGGGGGGGDTVPRPLELNGDDPELPVGGGGIGCCFTGLDPPRRIAFL